MLATHAFGAVIGFEAYVPVDCQVLWPFSKIVFMHALNVQGMRC